MDVRAALITDLQPSEAIQPRMRALYDPAMTTEFLLRLNSFTGDPRRDPSFTQCRLILFRLIPLIRMQLHGALAGTSSRPLDGLDRIQGLLEHRGVIDVRSGQLDRQRNALSIDNKMPLCALFSAIRRIFPGFFAPPGEATLEESMEALLQSMRSASPNSSNKTWWRRSQTPASCQSRRRRQQVMPLPQPISRGSISQGMPVRSTKRMPVKAARSGTRGRPPLGFGLSGGNSGAIRFHSLSSRSARISRPRITQTRFC
jgi:hypothetical protein